MLRFIEPLDGTILHTAGAEEGYILCTVEGRAQEIGGVPCECADGVSTAKVSVPVGGRIIEARDAEGNTASVWVGRLHTEEKLFRVSVDDCIWFLQDIAAHDYESIFENPFLALYKRLHDEYGAAVHMNIYLECPEHGGFRLPQLTDRYRAEWQANKDWLRLSFHAKANLPDWPYLHAGYDQVYQDCSAVMGEIRRFAGDMGAVTTMHFAETTKDGIRAMYDCGVRATLGDFSYDENGKEWLKYGATHEQFETVRKYGFWKDPETDMIFFPCDIVLNTMTPEEIPEELSHMAEAWPGRNFMDLLIHEQYFYEDYVIYEPDYEQRIRAGIEWCLKQGYKPGLAADVLGWE